MSVLNIIFNLIGGLLLIFFTLLGYSSLREKKWRAALICIFLLLLSGLFWFGLDYFFDYPYSIKIILILITLLSVFMFFVPTGISEDLSIGLINERVDERDVLFSREEYRAGSDKYEQYYRLRPENKEADDRLRRLPELFEPGGRYYDPVKSKEISDRFDQIKELTVKVDGEMDKIRYNVDPYEATRQLKQMTLDMGADEIGVALLNPMYVYSFVGRGPETWASRIINNHRFAIVFSLEMEYNAVDKAPELLITEETSFKYLKGAEISIKLAEYIRRLGYPARAHITGSNYQIMLPPVAYDAGLGELSRMGYLVSPKFGGRIRLGAVTTDLPLIPDKPINFGLQDFCERCKKCAINCPSGAIPSGSKSEVRGVRKWKMNAESCLYYWRAIGTDCGLCMKVCPFSHPPTTIHNLIRLGIKNSSLARRISLWGDDIFYGKKTNFYPVDKALVK